MSSATATIKHLHQIHTQLEQSREELAKGPRQIAVRKKMIQQKQVELAQHQEEIKQVKLQSERKSLDLKSLEKKLDDLKGKLNTASSNREYEIFSGQIQADTMAKSVLEDEIIELFEKIEVMSQQVPEMQQALQTSESDLQKYATDFEVRSQELHSQIEQLEKDLLSAEKILPQDPAEKYKRLVKSRGSRSLAQVVNNSCSSCFVQMTAQQKILIKSTAFVFCSNCGALLYLDD